MLDTIIADRNIICREMDIRFSYSIELVELKFINAVDLYVLFGNALDNAIEASCKLEKERRSIALAMKVHGDMLKITIENYMKGDITIRDGLPVTSKTDNHIHGYGLKSIYYITSKYQGNIMIKTDGGIFSLNILLPITDGGLQK